MKRATLKTDGNMGIVINNGDPDFIFGKEYDVINVWHKDNDVRLRFINAKVVCASGKSTPETRIHSEGIIITEILVEYSESIPSLS